ncbi:unnamed protein product [Angiostrongylus costaricensis]|uniref:RRM domain-containing protein n=1 Tax=Angiostrongylus costaricensis TaxID=334426 RepID=A0A0R3PTL1_ANGCS|nr:unnamed protein product [Angiostrongylus costaricensis]
MNPLTNIRNQNKLNERELQLGIAGDLRKSWHQRYGDSAWIYIGGLPYDLTEGDIITVFSQFGEVININLLRHADTGKSRGFCFLCYQDQRSTVLAVDNFNGITLLKRVIRVDHVEQYKVPKYKENADEETKRLWEEGCAPKPIRRTGIDGTQPERKKDTEIDAENAIVSLKEDEELRALRAKIKADRKREKKEKKKAKKEKKKLKKLMKSTKDDVNTDWKGQTKLLDKSVKEENFYGPNKHFNFGKKTEALEEPTHNVRPDFEKADWRDIEIWKEIREREKAEQGQKKSDWKPEEHYVSSRYR